jgi:hypothetical protein
VTSPSSDAIERSGARRRAPTLVTKSPNEFLKGVSTAGVAGHAYSDPYGDITSTSRVIMKGHRSLVVALLVCLRPTLTVTTTVTN